MRIVFSAHEKTSVAYLLLPFKSAKTGPEAGFFMPVKTIGANFRTFALHGKKMKVAMEREYRLCRAFGRRTCGPSCSRLITFTSL